MKLERQKTILVSLLKGYKKANRLATVERKKRLLQMTTEGSLREYDYLCSLYASIKRKGMEGLEGEKVSFLKRRRQIFNKIRKV